jgi:hypothetical protein
MFLLPAVLFVLLITVTVSRAFFSVQNIPWQLAQHERPDLFEFIEQKCGTGEMISNLKAGQLDVIVALTEGRFSSVIGLFSVYDVITIVIAT